MPTPIGVILASACCGAVACYGSMARSPKGSALEKRGNGCETPSGVARSEEACDERSEPQDVTSSRTRREGTNLQQEVEPHLTERSPSQLPRRKRTTDMRSAVK